MSVNYYDKDSEQLTKLAGSSALVMDSTPSSGSTNPVTSNGIYEALATKQNTLSFDSTPTASSTNPVTSGGVKTALDDKLAKSTISDAYNSATQYGVEGNTSGYPTYCISNNIVYECISACIGVAPPNATYWKAHVLADWIGQLSSDLASKIKVVRKSLTGLSYTIAENAVQYFTLDVNDETGYTPVGIVGVFRYGPSNQCATISEQYLNYGQAKIAVANGTSTSVSVTAIYVDVLYIAV